MSTNVNDQETKTDKVEEEVKPLFEASRRVLLAAIGAAALAQDEIEDFVKKLVDRGEIAEKDGKKEVPILQLPDGIVEFRTCVNLDFEDLPNLVQVG